MGVLVFVHDHEAIVMSSCVLHQEALEYGDDCTYTATKSTMASGKYGRTALARGISIELFCLLFYLSLRHWDPNRKFREANHFATRICESVSSLVMHVFRVAMKVLEKMSTLFKAKQFDKLSVLHGDDGNNAELTSTGDPQRMEAVLLGTVEESSMQAGNQSEQSVERSVESVEQSVESMESMEQSVEQSVKSVGLMESIERLVETVATGRVSLRTEPLETANVGFEIPSPIQARGRPKQTRKNKKAKRKQAIVRAIHDSELYDKKLTLSIIMDLLTHQATYATCFDQLNQLKPFVFLRKNQNHLQLTGLTSYLSVSQY
ncbi:LOW QUALITY PROTEIN: hypothetical protein PHMEG_00030150 [Phytophthora megakarya]|uniref:Uncharacterized protein n=1 Tax=Phytophthora megakarya TaxID=4795 RepID=A0A225V1U1_9STRA|nr:LOW QUALITY PROTEIN: hypothetical protein PHMEG_00030150 [Phytophthora megakarya]